MPQNLQDYIRESFAKGLKKDQIQASLLQAGWGKELVDQTFEDVELSQKEFIENHRKSFLPSKKFLKNLIKLIIKVFVVAIVIGGVYAAFTFVTRPKPSIITSLKIKGDENCVTKTNEAINLLRNKDPDNYEELAKRIDLIKCDKFAPHPVYRLENGKGLREFRVDPRTVDTGPVWYAGAIAHETCHARQFQEWEEIKASLSPEELERERNKDLEAECATVQVESLKKLGAEEYMISHVKSSYY